MEGPAVSTRTQEADSGLSPRLCAQPALLPDAAIRPRRGWHPPWRDLGLILVLMALVAGLRIWVLCHTEVAARDSIGFIRMAWQFEHQPAADVIRSSAQHPGYPLTLMVISWPIRQILGTTPVSMQLSAQATSALASVLLVIPMFLLGRELFDRRAGFWGAALFQCLPVTARILSDALSEATFFLFTTLAVLLAVRALRTGSVWRFALCGVFGGLAYLTRPEGILVVLAVGLVLLGVQAYPVWRRSWKQLLACGGSLTAAALVVGAPYVLITGHLTNKPTGNIVLKLAWLPDQEEAPHRATASLRGAVTQPLVASLFGIYAPEGLKDRRWWGLLAIGTEVTKSYEYFGVLPVLLGMWWFRDRLRVNPGAWVVIVLCALHGLVLWRLGSVVGYVSDRHVQLLVLFSVFTCAGALAVLSDWVAGLVAWLWRQPAPSAVKRSRWVSFVLLALVACAGLPESLRTLHANRAGHRAAGLWLASHAQPADIINDPFCWAHYYAGCVFLEGTNPVMPAGYGRTTYVVLDNPDHEHPRLPTLDNAKEQSKQGKVVYHWPENQPEVSAKIKVYAVPASSLAH